MTAKAKLRRDRAADPFKLNLMARGGMVPALALGLLVSLAAPDRIVGDTMVVPNASFESPLTPFVDTRIDSWQKTPKPFWYDESG